MSIDHCLHSLFGASKVAADVLVQEYGRYFGMPTACFRGGTLTGPNHSAAELHGFLAYVMRCTMTGTPYNVFGYKGKQVRDAIHSQRPDRRFDALLPGARASAEVYNIGGGRHSQLLRDRGDRAVRGDHRQEARLDLRRARTASATTSGGSATTAGSPSTTRAGSSSTTCRRILTEMHELNKERWT